MAAGDCNVSRKNYFHHSRVENHRPDKSLKTCGGQWFGSGNTVDKYDGRSKQKDGFVDRYVNKNIGNLRAPRDYIEVSDVKKKRKGSPIRWDRDDKEVVISSRSKVVQRSSPSLPVKVQIQENVKEDGDAASKWADVDSTKILPCSNHSSPESGEFYNGGSEETKDAFRFADMASEDDDYISVNGLEDYDSMEIDDKRQTSDEDEIKPISMLDGCRSVFKYEKLNKINEGTYGVVYRAKNKETGEIVALKKVKMPDQSEGFPITSLREINIHMSIHHGSIVEVKEVVMDEFDGVFVVMEYMEHDLKGMLDVMKHHYGQSEVKCLMIQLLEGVKILHDNWILHRDLKTSNLLLNNRGELKICDFGMARQYGSPLKPYTSLVVTLWYRAPEILLGAEMYSTAVDMWSIGCIMAELLAKEPLFSGKTELEQIDKIFRTLGTPSEAIWPGFSKLPGTKNRFVKQPYSMLRKKFPGATFTGSTVLTEAGFDLMSRLLSYDPNKRITAEEALNHEWFKQFPLPASRDSMPSYPAQHAKPCKNRA